MNLAQHLRISTATLLLACASGECAHPPGTRAADGAHEDHHHVDSTKVRTWTNSRTGEVVRGAFLAARKEASPGGSVRVSIEREGGDVVVFALADLTPADREEAQRRMDEVNAAHEQMPGLASARTLAQPASPVATKPGVPPQAAPFNAFAPFVSTRWDERLLYIESDGLPHIPGGKPGTYLYSHPLMIGITAWQQQVPLPQSYRGANAWQIPLTPVLAEKPVSAKEQLFRGAIALAANGVPIFNPIKNDGRTDTFIAGELDEFGGHCGRADDYHYHIAPMHLQKYVGQGQPIAYALDGFPIYGLFNSAAKKGAANESQCCPLGSLEPLDWLNGHHAPAPAGAPADAKGLYHYHASVKYPYVNGGMRGVVTVKEDQIDPQPRASSPRAALPPLRGAKITDFKATGKDTEPAWSLEYLLSGKKGFVNFRLETGKWIFDFIDPAGATKTDTYDATNPQRRQGGGGGGGGGGRRPREDGNRPPRDGAANGGPDPAVNSIPKAPASGWSLTSADVTNGRLSIECTCDGKSRSPSLTWGEPPTGTRAFAAVMHHITRDNDTHVYMVVANIPAAARELKGGEASVGTWGQNTVNRKGGYAPPCSQGPGDKSYTITLYALSAEVNLTETKPLTRDALLEAIKGSTLATTTLEVKYARAGR